MRLQRVVNNLTIFNLLQEKGNIPEHDMFNTFNMGIGMAMIVSPEEVERQYLL